MALLRIHCFQHVSFEGPGCIEDWIGERGHSLGITRLYKGESLPAVEEADWLIVTGGPMSVNDETQHRWLVAEKAFIKRAVDAGKMVLGICLGAQLIASALGAQVYPTNEKEIGWFPVFSTNEGSRHSLFESANSHPVFHWHGDTFDLPAGATLLASSEACLNQAFSVGERVVGLQYHLEITPDGLHEMLRHGERELKEALFVQRKEEILSQQGLTKETNGRMFRLLDHLEKTTRAGIQP